MKGYPEIELKIKRLNEQKHIEEIYLIKNSFIAYFNGMFESYLFDIQTGYQIENELLEKRVLKAIRIFLTK